MKAYLTAMLGNDQTLDWEEWLPALMFSCNTQVHKSTLESPFFLTYLHDPRLPFFDIKQPRPLYKEGFVPETTARLGTAYKQAHEHMEEARLLRERYYNKRAETRQFAVGDRCLVHFEATPRSANRKFIKKWKGVYTVTDIIGKVNLKLRATPQSKPILVHVNRVKHLKQSDYHEQFDSKRRTLEEKSGASGTSSSDEEGPQRDARPAKPRARVARPSKQRATASPTKFTLVREQRQPAGELSEFINYNATSGSDFLTAEESPNESTPEQSSGEELTFATPHHDVGQAIRERQARNQRPAVFPAGAEPADNEGSSSGDDPDVSFTMPRLTRRLAQDLNLQVSGQGLPPKTRQRK